MRLVAILKDRLYFAMLFRFGSAGGVQFLCCQGLEIQPCGITSTLNPSGILTLTVTMGPIFHTFLLDQILSL